MAKFKANGRFFKKIPAGAKAANILIGECDYLVEEVVALIQLETPILVENLSEVLVPTKYLFIALCPKGNIIKMRELGKCMGSLFSDEVIKLKS